MNSILGALVGDAAGATLEFCHKEITEEMAMWAMTMPGGGSICVGPGLEFDCTMNNTMNGTISSIRHNMRPVEYSVKQVLGHLI